MCKVACYIVENNYTILKMLTCSDDSIKVVVRVRPPDQQVTGDVENSLCLEVHDARTILMHTKPEHRIFTFDHVAGMETTQVMNL